MDTYNYVDTEVRTVCHVALGTTLASSTLNNLTRPTKTQKKNTRQVCMWDVSRSMWN